MDKHIYLQRKAELQSRLGQELARVAGDSDPGRWQSANCSADTAYQEGCRALLAEALDCLERQMDELRSEIKDRCVARCERRRRVLGDALAAELLRQRLERTSPAEVLQAYVDAADEWEATLIACFAEMLLPPDSQELAELQILSGDGQLAVCRRELADLERDARELWIALQPEALAW